MTVGGYDQQPPSAPSRSTARDTPAAPAPRRAGKRSGPAVALAAVIGLLVGAAVVGGIWWGRGSGTASPPAPIAISLDTLPASVLGTQRDDLALAALGNKNATANSTVTAEMFRASIPELKRAFGGPGITGTYGMLAAKTTYSLTIVNGMVSVPAATSDAQIRRLAAIGALNQIVAPGTATTTCVAGPAGSPVMLTKDTDLAKAKQQVLDSTESIVTCARHDWARNLSIELVGYSTGGSGRTAAKVQASRMAAEVDMLWKALAGS